MHRWTQPTAVHSLLMCSVRSDINLGSAVQLLSAAIVHLESKLSVEWCKV